MKKTFLIPFFVLSFILSFITVKAQIQRPGIMLGGNVNYAKPTGSFADQYSYGIGAEALAGVGLGKSFIVGTVGIATFRAHNKGTGHITYMPIKGGVRHYLVSRIVFVNADLGVGVIKHQSHTYNQFIGGVGAGVRFMGIEGALYYDNWRNHNGGGFNNNVLFKVGTSFVL
ncbi:hypothetical protein [Aridibaculum aurantiacum]|uniref:hypothetical protein n=1 Tax=Aridibaculum aurantiacum TaxID=2810307 RepID=UPI001A965599|nr:hypothetical protein [Aridibaculum aurantiacum]